jgi:hypothetical protein
MGVIARFFSSGSLCMEGLLTGTVSSPSVTYQKLGSGRQSDTMGTPTQDRPGPMLNP